MFSDLASGYVLGYHSPTDSSDSIAMARLVPSEGYHSVVAKKTGAT